MRTRCLSVIVIMNRDGWRFILIRMAFEEFLSCLQKAGVLFILRRLTSSLEVFRFDSMILVISLRASDLEPGGT